MRGDRQTTGTSFMESGRAVNLLFLSVNQQTPAKHLLSAWDCVRLGRQKSDKTYLLPHTSVAH